MKIIPYTGFYSYVILNDQGQWYYLNDHWTSPIEGDNLPRYEDIIDVRTNTIISVMGIFYIKTRYDSRNKQHIARIISLPNEVSNRLLSYYANVLDHSNISIAHILYDGKIYSSWSRRGSSETINVLGERFYKRVSDDDNIWIDMIELGSHLAVVNHMGSIFLLNDDINRTELIELKLPIDCVIVVGRTNLTKSSIIRI